MGGGPWAARCTGLLTQRPGYGAGPPPRAAPRGRQTVPRLPRGIPLCSWLGAVQAEGGQERGGWLQRERLALPVETNIYKQGLALPLAGLEL